MYINVKKYTSISEVYATNRASISFPFSLRSWQMLSQQNIASMINHNDNNMV